MQIETFIPQDKTLKKYIERFYILEHSQNEDKISYLTFPSLNSIVAVVLNAENIVSEDHITITSSETITLDTSLVCRFNFPFCFKYEGNIKEICIYFKPLGLNSFLPKPLASYSQTPFDPFTPFTDYSDEMKKILNIGDINELVDALEKYWSGKFKGFVHPFLDHALAKIEENPKITTSELAKEYGVSQKTVISQFKKHLCKTPSEYKKILRFRKALTKMKVSDQETKLTELSYIVDFFDQSHMIADFKSLTGLSPKIFFKQLRTIKNSTIHWIFN